MISPSIIVQGPHVYSSEGRTTIGEPHASAIEAALLYAVREKLPIQLYGGGAPYHHVEVAANLHGPKVILGVNRPMIGPNPVGGSDTFEIRSGDLVVYGVDFDADDRGALKTTAQNPVDRALFADCEINGKFGPSPERWGVHGYHTSHFSFIDFRVFNIIKGVNEDGGNEEHCFYFHLHGKTGRHHFLRGLSKRSARTDKQFVSRKGEGIAPLPGLILIEECLAEDVCLEAGGGGSALTFRGAANQDIVVRRYKVKLGCNPKLAEVLPGREKNITGGLLCDTPADSHSPARSLSIRGSEFEVGEVFPGVGSARRTNVKILSVGRLEILPDTDETGQIRKTRIIQHQDSPLGKAFERALEIDASNIPDGVRLSRDGVEIRGECVWDGRPYASWTDMVKAVEGSPGVEIVD